MIPTVNDYFGAQAKQNKAGQTINIQMATVYEITLDGDAILIFPAETLPSPVIRKKPDYYTPKIGDTVMISNNRIIGGWTT